MISPTIKKHVIKLAIFEGKLKLEGNELKGGRKIEKYLAPFRAIFIKHNPLYLNMQQGFQWCCAYIYYILTKAGLDISIRPFNNSTVHLGSVRAWADYAAQQNKLYRSWQGIEAGDIVIFDHLIEAPLDHLGIVIEARGDHLLCSEGNFHNKSGIFRREKDAKIWGYIKL